MDPFLVALVLWSVCWFVALVAWSRSPGWVVFGGIAGVAVAAFASRPEGDFPWETTQLVAMLGLGGCAGATALGFLAGLTKIPSKPGPQAALMVFVLAPLAALGHDLFRAGEARLAAGVEQAVFELAHVVDTQGADREAVAARIEATQSHARFLTRSPAATLWSPGLRALGQDLWGLRGAVPGHGLVPDFKLSGPSLRLPGSTPDPELVAIQAVLRQLQDETKVLGTDVFAHRTVGLVAHARARQAQATERALLPWLVQLCEQS